MKTVTDFVHDVEETPDLSIVLGRQCNCFFKSECKEVLYYYHSDQVGSSTFLSDAYGKSYEFMLYLPYGEEMTDRCEAKS